MSSGVEISAVECYCPECDTSYPEGVDHCPKDGEPLVRLSSDPLLGAVIDDRFAIKSRLGAGGMGVVYRANQSSIRRDVAIKVIHARLTQGASTAKRFLREARLCSKLAHPNIVTVLDFGQSSDGLLFLVMELLEGRILGSVLAEDGPFPIKRLLRVGLQMCEALEAAHEASIVHRDLKPSNVVVLARPAGRDYLKVLDFGLAKSVGEDASTALTHSDAIIGTPAYISPEAIKTEPMDERSDLYSLGVILYELLCGRLPFAGGSATDMLRRHLTDEPHPIPAAVDARVSGLILRMLAKNPAERPASAREIREALEAIQGLDAPGLPWPGAGPPDPMLGMESTMVSDRGSAETLAADDDPETTQSGEIDPAEPEPAPSPRRWPMIAVAGVVATVAVAAVLWLTRVTIALAIDVRTSPPPDIEPTPPANPAVTRPVLDAGPAPAPVVIDAAPPRPKPDTPIKQPKPDKPKPRFLEDAP